MQAFDDMTVEERHRTPITASEITKLYKLEKNQTHKWEQVCNKGGLKCEKVIPTDSTCVLIRASADLPGLNANAVFYHICNFERRLQWDKNFAEMIMIEEAAHAEDKSSNDVIYSVIRCSPVTDRDFLQFRLCLVSDDVIWAENKGYEYQ